MLSVKELSKVYETILMSPGMDERVKLTLKVSRRDLLMLFQLIERGLGHEELKQLFPPDAATTLRAVGDELVAAGAFTPEFIERFKELTGGKGAA